MAKRALLFLAICLFLFSSSAAIPVWADLAQSLQQLMGAGQQIYRQYQQPPQNAINPTPYYTNPVSPLPIPQGYYPIILPQKSTWVGSISQKKWPMTFADSLNLTVSGTNVFGTAISVSPDGNHYSINNFQGTIEDKVIHLRPVQTKEETSPAEGLISWCHTGVTTLVMSSDSNTLSGIFDYSPCNYGTVYLQRFLPLMDGGYSH